MPTPARRPALDPSQISHTIPGRLRQGRAQVVEIRIDRPPITGFGASGSRSHALRSEAIVARAIAVRLRPLAGRFVVESLSPETLWDQGTGADAGRLGSEAAVWRFSVTPLSTGRGALQLAVSARTVGADGVLADSRLDEQAYEIRASRNLGGAARRVAVGAGLFLAGVAAIKAVEFAVGFDLAFLARQLLRF